jgi:RNA polymerase sigma-70 factor (ECF subfamily)
VYIAVSALEITMRAQPSKCSTALGGFATTRWNVVAAAGRADDTASREALDQLCRIYWRPTYAYVRCKGYSPHDAQDLTQGFFEQLLQNRFLAAAHPTKGRFRSYLLTAVQHHLANCWRYARAQKRGGDCLFVPLDAVTDEGRYGLELADTSNPERAFDCHWALTVLQRVLDRLGAEYQKAGKSAAFEELRDRLMGDTNATPYAQVAAKLGMTESAARMAVNRLRSRFRTLVREEVSHTVADPAGVDEEIGELFAALGR